MSARLGEVETVEYQRDRGMGVTVYFGTRKGSASTADLSAAGLRETVAKACSIARFTAEDPCAGLPDPDMLAQRRARTSTSRIPGTSRRSAPASWRSRAKRPRWRSTRASPIRKARASARTAACAPTAIRTASSARYPGTAHSISCAVLGSEGEQMERDYWYSTARDWRELEAAESVGRRSGERAVRRLGARKLATMKVPVLYSPDVARGLIGHFLGAIRGGSQYRRSSFLLDAAGSQVFPDWFALSERPHLPKALASAPFDHEGVATQRSRARRGRRAARLRARARTRRASSGCKTTGNAGGIHNLLVHGRGRDFDAHARATRDAACSSPS